MRGSLCSAVAVLGVAASLFAAASPPVASAKSGYLTIPAERLSHLTVKGTHGFRITIERISGRVELTASNGNTAAIYVVRSAKIPPDRIRATFPGLGRVSVGFHLSGRVHREPGFCEKRPTFRQNGIFGGTILFEGEQGFTRINIDSAPGIVFRSVKEICKGSRGRDSEATKGYSLTEQARSRGATTVSRRRNRRRVGHRSLSSVLCFPVGEATWGAQRQGRLCTGRRRYLRNRRVSTSAGIRGNHASVAFQWDCRLPSVFRCAGEMGRDARG